MPSPAQQKNKPKPLDKLTVKIALLKKGWSQARLAQEVKSSVTTVNLTINHNTSSDVNLKIRKALAI